MAIEEIDVASMPPEERAVLYEELRRVDCMTRISPGVTRGINAAFLKDKLRAILRGVPYGEPGGHKRRILSVFLRRSGAVSTRARQVRPVSAFALVCAPARQFHRLRHEHVKRSVFLALLCGTGATDIMRAVVEKYATDQGLMITLDSLAHVIPYYLRPEFGVARMIDTEASFARSGVIQRAYRRASTRDERRKVRASAESMSNEILKAEEFTPPAECVVRERDVPDYDYLQAHIVILPPGLESISFEELCKPTARRSAASQSKQKRASRNSKKGSASKVRRSVTGRFSR
jgi:hypothetical protein